MTANLPSPRYRPLRFGVTEVTTRQGDNGVVYVRATQDLQPHPVRLTDRLARQVVEGVIVEENSVISMGVYIGQSTKIYDRATGTVTYGRIPAGSVVVSGNLPSADGKYSLYCAVIVKQVDAKTRAKTSINDLLRGLAE